LGNLRKYACDDKAVSSERKHAESQHEQATVHQLILLNASVIQTRAAGAVFAICSALFFCCRATLNVRIALWTLAPIEPAVITNDAHNAMSNCAGLCDRMRLK
jgi:hypothetical protein